MVRVNDTKLVAEIDLCQTVWDIFDSESTQFFSKFDFGDGVGMFCQLNDHIGRRLICTGGNREPAPAGFLGERINDKALGPTTVCIPFPVQGPFIRPGLKDLFCLHRVFTFLHSDRKGSELPARIVCKEKNFGPVALTHGKGQRYARVNALCFDNSQLHA